MTSDAERADWKQYRRLARRYERELKRIMQATLCDAEQLRRFAAEALDKPKKQKRNDQ